jgi:DNA-binding SARP family transcriptional activator
MIDVGVLGTLHVRRDGRELVLTPTQVLVLLVLAIAGGHPVAKHTLQRRVYDREPDRRTEQNLRRHVKDLRDRLCEGLLPYGSGPGTGSAVIVTTRLGSQTAYRLDPHAVRMDAPRFEQHVTAGCAALRAGHCAEAATYFQDAQDLWRGDPLADVADHAFAASWITRLQSWHRIAVCGHAEAFIRLGRHREAIPALQASTAAHPSDGWLWQLLAIALYADLRDGDAAHALRDAIDAFRSEGLDPRFFSQLHHGILTLTLPRDANQALDTLASAKHPASPDAAA